MFPSNKEHQEFSKNNLAHIIASITDKVNERKMQNRNRPPSKRLKSAITYTLPSSALDAQCVSLRDVQVELRNAGYMLKTEKEWSLHCPVVYLLMVSW